MIARLLDRFATVFQVAVGPIVEVEEARRARIQQHRLDNERCPKPGTKG